MVNMYSIGQMNYGYGQNGVNYFQQQKAKYAANTEDTFKGLPYVQTWHTPLIPEVPRAKHENWLTKLIKCFS